MASKPFPSGHDLASADVNDLVGVYDRSTSEVDVVNTTTETTVYSKAIGAGHLSNNRMLRLRLFADYLQNSGTGSLTVLVKMGATTVLTFSVGGVTASGARYAASMTVEILNLGATNSQLITYQVPAFSTNNVGVSVPVTAAVDTTVAQTLTVTVQHDAASVNRSYRKRGALLELL